MHLGYHILQLSRIGNIEICLRNPFAAPTFQQSFGCFHTAKSIIRVTEIRGVVIHIRGIVFISYNVKNTYNFHVYCGRIALWIINASQGIANFQPIPIGQIPANHQPI